MALSDVENAMRLEAAAWAQSNSVRLHWQNTTAKNPHVGETIAWRFEPIGQERLTAATVLHTGRAEAHIYVPKGTGVARALELAGSLQAQFMGRVFGGAIVQDEVSIVKVGREGSSYRIDVRIPWEFEERRIPQASVGPHDDTPGALSAYQAFRDRWDAQVRAPLSLKTFFDNSPPEDETPPPWAFVTFRTLEPVRVEVQTLRVPGRVIAALNLPLATGVAETNAAIAQIVAAFDQCSFSGIHFGTPEVTRVGRTAAETWQANVRLPFHYEVTP